jgi:arsenical pump membrane protein
VAPLGSVAVLAALVGLDAGSGLNLPRLAGRTAVAAEPRAAHRAGIAAPVGADLPRPLVLVAPPAVVLAVVVLWAWNGVWSGLVW